MGLEPADDEHVSANVDDNVGLHGFTPASRNVRIDIRRCNTMAPSTWEALLMLDSSGEADDSNDSDISTVAEIKTSYRRLGEATDDDEKPKAVSVRYAAQGAAHVVFRLEPPQQDAPSHNLHVIERDDHTALERAEACQWLIRVKKSTNPSSTVSMLRPIRDGEQHIATLFPPSDRHLLCTVSPLAMYRRCWDTLQAEAQRHGAEIKMPTRADPEYGSLVEDMSATAGAACMFEFKPKWVGGSPTPGCKPMRCRNCALRAQRTQQAAREGRPPPIDPICASVLVASSLSVPHVREYVRAKLGVNKLWQPLAGALQELVVDSITRYLTEGDGFRIIQRLCELQKQLDPRGPVEIYNDYGAAHRKALERLPSVRDLCRAMTLRDCSLLVRVFHDGSSVTKVVGKLADLDVKKATKLYEWKDKETALADGGWYQAEEGGRPRDYDLSCGYSRSLMPGPVGSPQ